jgi:NAD(P)-dependent dehydrogenase (short-subunit alcohol dehydrogenase family)
MPSNRNGSRHARKDTVAAAPPKPAELHSSRFAPGAYFRDRVVFITGASSGIGRDLALTFAKMGAKVALIARRKSLLEDLAAEIAAAGGDALALADDVTRRADVRDAIDRTLAHFGRIDILINSAGIAIPNRVETMPPEDLERMMAVNLMGTLHTMQAVLPSMRAAGAGSIVNIASLAGRRGMPPLGAYCATKFAVVGLTEALRVELFGSGIRLSLVMPGVIDTPMVHGASTTAHPDSDRSGADRSASASAGDVYQLMPDSIPAMPTQWVTWAVIAAVVLGLAEIDVPPGAVVMEKIAALFPGLTDAFLALGTRLFSWATHR